MPGLLEGLKVVEMGLVFAAPAVASMMAEWGADVIKVEPVSGELSRASSRSHGISREIEIAGSMVNWIYQLHNRCKRGIALDLKQKAGREILYKLIGQADMFVTNYQARVLKRFEMDYDTLSKMYPRLIYGSISGYGKHGPDKDKRGFDLTAAWANSGTQYMTGEPDGVPPMVRAGMMDRTAASYLTAGLLAAVINRDRTGKGEEIDVSLYHTAVWSISSDIQSYLIGRPFPRHDHAKVADPLKNNYRTSDNRWLILFNLRFEDAWPGFCRCIDRPELADDPKFNTKSAIEKHGQELIPVIDDIFAGKPLEEWGKRLKEHNMIYALVQTPSEVIKDPQALANDFFSTITFPGGERLDVVNTPVRFRANPSSIKSPSPKIGEHTEEILKELGYKADEVAGFKDQGIIPK